MLEKENTVLTIVDVQGKLAELMYRHDFLFENLRRLIQGAGLLGIPVILMEHLPEKLGPTVEAVKSLLPNLVPIWKNTFSCVQNREFRDRLAALEAGNILLAGIESHICVYQTAVELVELGYRVEVVTDGVSSRTEQNYKLGLARMSGAGAHLTSVEMLLFELQKVAEGEVFRELVKLVK